MMIILIAGDIANIGLVSDMQPPTIVNRCRTGTSSTNARKGPMSCMPVPIPTKTLWLELEDEMNYLW